MQLHVKSFKIKVSNGATISSATPYGVSELVTAVSPTYCCIRTSMRVSVAQTASALVKNIVFHFRIRCALFIISFVLLIVRRNLMMCTC